MCEHYHGAPIEGREKFVAIFAVNYTVSPLKTEQIGGPANFYLGPGMLRTDPLDLLGFGWRVCSPVNGVGRREWLSPYYNKGEATGEEPASLIILT